MSEELKPCPFCGSDDITYTGKIFCVSCGAEAPICAWNTRAASKPEYKYATEEELQEAKGWYTGEFQEAITFAFNAAREVKDE